MTDATTRRPHPLDGFRLDGRVAVVTGASSGIGARTASTLDRLGATVVACARRTDRLETLTSGMGNGHALTVDLGVDGANAALIDQVVERFGRVDVVVANAAVSRVAPALRESTSTFLEQLAFDVAGPFELARTAATAMRTAGRGGSIVMVGSVVAHRIQTGVPTAGYTAAKSALVGLTRELAAQWARYGIRVNAISPGLFPTEMTADLVESDALRSEAEARIPLGRIGRLEELDGPLAFLCSDASAYVTGHALVVDGGWSL